MKKFKKGDTVQVTLGKDKGKSGEIVRVIPKSDSVIVKGLNMYKRHLKPTRDTQGGIVSRERPLSVAKISHTQDGQLIRFNQRKSK